MAKWLKSGDYSKRPNLILLLITSRKRPKPRAHTIDGHSRYI